MLQQFCFWPWQDKDDRAASLTEPGTALVPELNVWPDPANRLYVCRGRPQPVRTDTPELLFVERLLSTTQPSAFFTQKATPSHLEQLLTASCDLLLKQSCAMQSDIHCCFLNSILRILANDGRGFGCLWEVSAHHEDAVALSDLSHRVKQGATKPSPCFFGVPSTPAIHGKSRFES